MLHFRETYRQVENIGFVADFCPICREVRPFTLQKVMAVKESVVVLVALPAFERNESTEVGEDRVCNVCNFDLPTIATRYTSVVSDAEPSLEVLIRETNPEIFKTTGERLALEQRIRSGKVEPGQRREFLLEPFQALEPRIKRARGEGSRGMLRLVIVSMILSIAGLFLSDFIHNSMRGRLQGVCGVVLALAVILLIRLAFLGVHRKAKLGLVLRAEIYPMLGRALKPLNPGREELLEILQDLRRGRTISGSVLDPEKILAEMQCIR